MNFRNRALFVAALLCTTAPCASFAATASAPASVPGIDVTGMDKSVAPGDDFFAYANGTWLKTTDIPPDRAAWGVGSIVSERADGQVRDLITNAGATHPAKNSNAGLVANFYTAFMDEAGIEAKGLTPLKASLNAVSAIKDRKTLAGYLGGQLRADVDALNSTNFYTSNLFGLWVTQSPTSPEEYVPCLLQGGLGMPDREYYVSSDKHMVDLRAKYLTHITAMLKLAGIPDADAKAQRIMDLETKIAQSHGTREDSEDIHKGFNPWQMADFAKNAPGMDWGAYFKAAGLDKQATFMVWHVSAAKGESALVASEPLATWKDYLTLRLIEHYGPMLPKAFVDERFSFYGTALSGAPKNRDRWKRAISATNGALGEVVGHLYVDKYFPPESKAKVEAMVQDLIAAFDKRIDNLAWMAPSTKASAKAKLKTLYVGVGYPEKWRDYSALDIEPDDAVGNQMRAELFQYKFETGKLGGPVDHHQWSMTPQEVNAVNMPLQNALNFPAAILQPPFFDPNGNAVTNFGAIGSVIGHEISHSFDDQGSQINAEGRLINWWTPSDFDHFQSSAAALIAEFDAYMPFPDLHENGKQTISENIADVAGLSASYDAYRLSYGGKEAPKIGGYTGDQQFFIAFAQGWRTKVREQAARAAVTTDGHALPEYRGDTVRNLDAWYPAFKVKPDQKLYLAPDKRVKMW